MARSVKVNVATQFSERLLEVLRERRAYDPTGYFPAKSVLLAAAGTTPEPEVLAKALGGPFKKATLVAAAHDDSPVALKEDLAQLAASDALFEFVQRVTNATPESPALLKDFIKPIADKGLKPLFQAAVEQRIAAGTTAAVLLKAPPKSKPLKPEVVLASKMLEFLRTQREHKPSNYMLSLDDLVSEAGAQPTDPVVPLALKHKSFKEALIFPATSPQAPVAFKEDAAALAASDALHEYAKQATGATNQSAVLLKDFVAKVNKDLKQPFEAETQRRMAAGTAPYVVLKKIAPEQVLAQNLLKVLRSQRGIGEASYPLAFERLVGLTDAKASVALATKALATDTFQSATTVLIAKQYTSPVVLNEDQALLAAAGSTLEYLVQSLRTADSHTVTGGAMAAKIKDLPLQEMFKAALKDQVENGTLPATVAYVLEKKAAKFFLLSDLQPARRLARAPDSAEEEKPHSAAAESPSPARGNSTATVTAPASTSFATQFETAFTRLDRQAGGHNFVKLLHLREALGQYPRAEFDAGLRELRVAKKFTLSAGQSKFGLSPQELEAGIEEAGTILSNISRRAT